MDIDMYEDLLRMVLQFGMKSLLEVIAVTNRPRRSVNNWNVWEQTVSVSKERPMDEDIARHVMNALRNDSKLVSSWRKNETRCFLANEIERNFRAEKNARIAKLEKEYQDKVELELSKF